MVLINSDCSANLNVSSHKMENICNNAGFFLLDLRQDMLTLQMLRLMDLLWKEAGLDLR